MGLGIKEPITFDGEITGTFKLLSSSNDSNNNSEDESTFKKTKNGIILNPQPHDNPNDPLNWSILKRDVALLVLGWHCFVGGGQSSLLAAGLTQLGDEFNESSSTLAYLVGGFMLSMGFGAIFASPTAILIGKRFVYIFGIILFLAGSIWGALAQSFGSMMGARVLMGIGISPVESLPSATIAEIYFAHERAYRIGIYTLLLLGGKNLVPMFSAFVFQKLDRHWLFWIITIISGINLILHFLFVPETFWSRAPIPNKRSLNETKAARNALLQQRLSNEALYDDPEHNSQLKELESELTSHETTNNYQTALHKKKSYLNGLNLFSGIHSKTKWWKVFLRPFGLFLYPHICFGALLYAFAVVWLIMISEVISEIFTNPPYGYSKLSVGLFYISPFIGGSLGSAVAGKLSDIMVRYLVKKNNGIYEPELRLLMVLPSVLATCIGLIGFGWSSEVNHVWTGPIILFGVLAFGSSLASTTSITFAVDSYKMFASETLVTLNATKNIFGFLFSLFNNEFNHKEGYKHGFVVYGCIEIFIGLFAIPLYIYGKRIRKWTDEKGLMRSLYDKNSEHVD
ncbi:putative membrane protein [Wickerhamomyces ciferrii]|uniref:Membrane protein n=1 Tax=Wickerhamomyces ciferrii (strain ATCC 14091 / BCRC 22168 / CBS 111 / JCM 3599 / NBRC 0793 / NRRL Y-1031 F-60-10) TaxID=1206466 RepID=K0KV79_WICCF|nr:uncharacterized protein BN7_4651 [Wickerhamomyces ciferrii]CCH45073.1 putative membrane protein [Wickerhamomyces ciferrii]